MKLLTIVCVIQAFGLARFILGQTNQTQDEAIEIPEPVEDNKVVHNQNSTESGVSEDYPASVSPPYCDPYVEYCGGGYDYYPYNYYSYSKGDLHPVVWTSAFQFGIPMLIFKSLEEAAY